MHKKPQKHKSVVIFSQIVEKERRQNVIPDTGYVPELTFLFIIDRNYKKFKSKTSKKINKNGAIQTSMQFWLIIHSILYSSCARLTETSQVGKLPVLKEMFKPKSEMLTSW